MKTFLTALLLFGALSMFAQLDSVLLPIEDPVVDVALDGVADSYEEVTEALPDFVDSKEDWFRIASFAQLDSVLLPIEDPVVDVALDGVADSYEEVTEALPDFVDSKEDLFRIAALVFGFFTIVLTRISGTNEKISKWVDKNASNGVLHLISVVVSVLIGLFIIPGSIDARMVFDFAIGVAGVGFIVFQLSRVIPGLANFAPAIKGVLEFILGWMKIPTKAEPES